MPSHRPSFVTKNQLRNICATLRETVSSLQDSLADARYKETRSDMRIADLTAKVAQNAFLVTELKGQVETQSNIVTSAKVAAQESHKAYQKAFQRGIELQDEVYQLQKSEEFILSLLNQPTMWQRIKEYFSDIGF